MIKRILTSSVHSITSRLFITITNLFVIYFISKNLSSADLGNYGIAFFFHIFFATISSFTLYLYYGKEFVRYQKGSSEESELVNEFVTILIIGLGMTIVSPFLISLFYSKINFGLIMLSCFAGYVLGIERNLGGFLLGKEKMPFESFSNFVSLTVTVVPMLFFSVYFNSVEKIFFLRILSLLVAAALKFFYVRDMFNVKKLRFKFYSFKEIKYYCFTGISSSILREADVFILSFFIDKSLLGGYFLALRIFYAFGNLAEVVSSALTPFISGYYSDRANGGFRRFNKYMLPVFMLFAIIFSILLLVSRNIILEAFSPANLIESGKYLFFFSFFLFFRFMSFSTGIILTSADLQKTRFRIMFLASMILIFLEIVLGSQFKIMGILISRGIVEVFIFIVFGIFVNKLLKK